MSTKPFAFIAFLVARARDLPALIVICWLAGNDIAATINLQLTVISQHVLKLMPTSLHAQTWHRKEKC